MNKIPVKELSNSAMVAGNESKYQIVVDGGILKEWVGIGWIELREALPDDIGKYPVVERT